MSEDRTDQTPFVGELKDTGFSSNSIIKKTKENSDKLIRIGSSNNDALDATYSPENLSKYQTGVALFQELQDEYGIKTPSINLVIGKDSDDAEKIFTVTDRVLGENLMTTVEENKSPEFTQKLSEFIDRLSFYYYDKLNSKQPFIYDINKLGDFVYGRLPGEAADQIHLVDLDPHYTSYEGSDAFNFESIKAITSLMPLITMIQIIETSNPGVTTTVARKRILDFTESIPGDSILSAYGYKIAEELNKQIPNNKQAADI